MTHAPQTPGIEFEKLSLKDALDLATLIEEEARDRYEELAAQLALHHTQGAAAFFTKMVRVEELHRAALAEQRRKQFGDAAIEVRREMIFDVEAPGYDAVRAGMTERDALELALESEKRAQAFFDGALASVRDPGVRKLFQELAEEEREHQRLVRQELSRLGPDDPLSRVDVSDDPAAQ